MWGRGLAEWAPMRRRGSRSAPAPGTLPPNAVEACGEGTGATGEGPAGRGDAEISDGDGHADTSEGKSPRHEGQEGLNPLEAARLREAVALRQCLHSLLGVGCGSAADSGAAADSAGGADSVARPSASAVLC